MNNFEEKLNKIKTKKIGAEVKDSLWHSIVLAKMESDRGSFLQVNIFNLSMKKMIFGVMALVLVLGGAGVVAASDDSMPGDFLFPVDLAVEKLQLRLADESKATELKLRFAEERVGEIKKVSEEKTVPVELIKDLSGVTVAGIEADVFTNETVVKIEAGDKKYGYVSTLKTKAELAKEISEKYSIALATVESLIDFQIENRASRADDKGFLNKTHSVVFDDSEEDDMSEALTDLEELLGDDDSEKAEELRSALKEVLILLGDENDLEIRKNGNQIRIEGENGDIKIKLENKEDNSGKGKGNSSDLKIKLDDSSEGNDVKEDDSEVFCRGEWRDAEDCDDSEKVDDDSDDSDDDSAEIEDDDSSDDSDDDEDDDSGKDDEGDDDNSGKGSGDDKDNDD